MTHSTSPLPTQDAAIDAIVGHLKHRLDQVLYEQPMQNLTKRRDELDRRHTELQARRAQLLARADAATTLQQHSVALEQQLLSARIDVATETRGRELLEKMVAESTARRDDTRAKRDDKRAKFARLNAELAALMERLNATKTPEESKRTVATVQAEAQALQAAIDQFEEIAKDQQGMVAALLEQLPSSALATQRATARLQSLVEEQKSLEERQVNFSSARSAEADAERLQIDIAVTRTMLTEIQGKLARLQPVQYELVRQR